VQMDGCGDVQMNQCADELGVQIGGFEFGKVFFGF
jgi:hypothetical protein